MLASSACIYADSHINTQNWQEVLTSVENTTQIPEQTLILFDVNDVLIAPTDIILSKYHRQEAIDKIKKIHNIEQNEAQPGVHPVLREDLAVTKTFMDIWTKTHIDVVDQDGPQAIQALQEKGYNVMGLTNGITGSIGGITNMVGYRSDELYRLGYTFKGPNGLGKIPLGTAVAVGNGAPIYQDGIIYTAGQAKGPVLDTFLQKSHIKPNKIILVDDKKGNLDSVATFCRKHGIDFVGIEFNALARQQKYVSYDKKIGACQFEHYQKYHQWLSDQDTTKTACFRKSV